MNRIRDQSTSKSYSVLSIGSPINETGSLLFQ